MSNTQKKKRMQKLRRPTRYFFIPNRKILNRASERIFVVINSESIGLAKVMCIFQFLKVRNVLSIPF